MPKKRRELSEKIAAAIAHKALHALQIDFEERFGFRGYRFSESRGRLIVGNCAGNCADEVRDLWLFRGSFTATGFVRTYEVFVGVRQEDDSAGLRYERIVTAEILDPGNGGLDYKIEIPAYGEKGTVKIRKARIIRVPDQREDILSGLTEVLERDHLGVDPDEVEVD